MQTLDERRAGLRRVGAFSQVAAGDLDTLLSCLRWRTLAAGDVLFREGDYGDALVVVADGALSVRVRRGEADVEIARVGAGELVGEMVCVDPAPRSATLVALSPAVVAELSRDALHAMRAGAPALSALVVGAVIREVTRRLRDIEARVDREVSPSRPPPSPPSPSPPSPMSSASERPPERSGLQRLFDRVRGRA
ncbi:MAG: cyclic nucleotide-binding domain-containing protein [Myxococcaceae bacterium]|nr:MAG: cyclic nucleotide-binding domain-containing protein [Myxococcaceae bacterium]